MSEILNNLNSINSNKLRLEKTSFKSQDNNLQTNLPEAKSDTFEKSGKVDASNDGKFTWKEAGKNFLKGAFIKPFEYMFSSPGNFVKTLVGGAVMGYVTLHCLPLAGLAIAAGAFTGVLGIGGGVLKAVKSKAEGKNDEAEKAFSDIGQSTFTLASTAFYARGLAKATGSSKITPFKLTPKGIATWTKESIGAIKAEGFDSLASAWHVGWASIKGGFGAAKQTYFAKNGSSFFKNYSSLRHQVLGKIHSSGVTKQSYNFDKAYQQFDDQAQLFRNSQKPGYSGSKVESPRLFPDKLTQDQQRNIFQGIGADDAATVVKGPLHRFRMKIAKGIGMDSDKKGFLSSIKRFFAGENTGISGKQRYFAEVVERQAKSRNYLNNSEKLLTQFNEAKNVASWATLENITQKELPKEAAKEATNITQNMG